MHDHIWWSYLISFLLKIIKQSKENLLKKLILFNFLVHFRDFVSLHPTLKIAEETTTAVGYVVERLYTERGIDYDMYKIFWFFPFFYAFLMPKYLTYVFCPCFTTLPCEIIIQRTHFVFIRACCSSLFSHKGTWEWFTLSFCL